jgi:hypothetical protein
MAYLQDNWQLKGEREDEPHRLENDKNNRMTLRVPMIRCRSGWPSVSKSKNAPERERMVATSVIG